jgi:O-antigen/teichoic acid export membrane protein
MTLAVVRSHLLTLYRSTTVRATLIFGFAGVANMAGNLVLARQLSALEFAGVALFLTFTQIGTTFGTAGAETVITRHGLSPNLRLLVTLVTFASIVAVVLFVVCLAVYEMTPALAAVTFAAIVSSAIVRVEAAFYQSRQKFRVSLLLLQAYTFVLFAVGVGAFFLGMQGAFLPCALMTACFVLVAIWGWHAADRSYTAAQRVDTPYPWAEAWPLIGLGAAGVLSLQAERLLIPQLLSVELLANYAVLAALASAPFQMLMTGVGYTMMPRLKNSASLQHRRKIVRNELLVVSLIALTGAAFVLLLAPFLARVFTAGMYTLSDDLVAAAVVTGLGKVVNGFASAVLRALGTTRDLQRLNVSAWLGLVVAVAAAVPAAAFGLVGIVLAVGLGWFARSAMLLPSLVSVLAEPSRSPA